jgi:GGDEF domain-containing protein
VARRLESSVRESGTVSRHGGDEFLALLAEVSHPSDAGIIATKMLSVLAMYRAKRRGRGRLEFYAS